MLLSNGQAPAPPGGDVFEEKYKWNGNKAHEREEAEVVHEGQHVGLLDQRLVNQAVSHGLRLRRSYLAGQGGVGRLRGVLINRIVGRKMGYQRCLMGLPFQFLDDAPQLRFRHLLV